MREGTTKIAERVRHLIALAGSSNENEARNAAATACRLIREHGLEVRSQREPATRHGSGRDRWATDDRWEPVPPPRQRQTRGPYRLRRDVANVRCCECHETIGLGDALEVLGDGWTQGEHVHGDCVPAAERP